MNEQIRNGLIYLDGTNLEKIQDVYTVSEDKYEKVEFVPCLVASSVRKHLLNVDKRTYKFYFPKQKLENIQSFSNVSPGRYAWFGLIKMTEIEIPSCSEEISSNIKFVRDYELTEADIDYLLVKWKQQYIESEQLKNKVDSIKNHFVNALARFENYKDHFVFIKDGVIVANLSVKYFYYPVVGGECSAIHMWIDQESLKPEEKKYIHYSFLEEIERINKFAQMFCGISTQNIKALRNIEKYGFVPYFLESKVYE